VDKTPGLREKYSSTPQKQPPANTIFFIEIPPLLCPLLHLCEVFELSDLKHVR